MLAETVSCPIVLYEWPQAENYFIDAGMFRDLVAAGRVQGIKDTTCTPEGIAAKQRVAGSATVFQANTPYILDALNLGVGGLMMITSSARCDLVVRLWAAHRNGDAETAAALERELVFLDAVLRFAYPATAKYLVSLQGVEMPTAVRWPVTLTSEARRALETWQRGAPGSAS
jgi:4-hydroxy-tetrahydrodipicolinate synthase